MKAIHHTLLVILLAVFFACDREGDELGDPRAGIPPIPMMFDIDINEDAIPDCRIEYSLYVWDGSRATGEGISGSFTGLPEISVLLTDDNIALFLQKNDTLSAVDSDSSSWHLFYSTLHLFSIQNSSENNYEWPDEWSIRSTRKQNPYYIGVKYKVNDQDQLAWLKLIIDKKTGIVTILDKKSTSENFLVIDK